MNNVPLAGDEFEVVGSLDVARERAESRAEYLRNERITAKAGDGKVTLSSFASAVSAGKTAGLDLHQLNIVLKVDVQVCIHSGRRVWRKFVFLLKPYHSIIFNHSSVSSFRKYAAK